METRTAEKQALRYSAVGSDTTGCVSGRRRNRFDIYGVYRRTNVLR